MGGQADVPYLALLLGFQQRFHRTAGGQDGFQVFQAGIVELVQLNVVGAQVFQAFGQLGAHILGGEGAAFGGQHELIPQAQFFQRLPDPAFADGVCPGGIDIVDACFMHRLEQSAGARLIDALDGNTAKAQTGDFQAGLAQRNILHDTKPPNPWKNSVFWGLLYQFSALLSAVFVDIGPLVR